MSYSDGMVGMVCLLVGSIVLFLFIGMLTGRITERGTFWRMRHPRQWEILAGSMHREPVYPGEDDPIRTDDDHPVVPH